MMNQNDGCPPTDFAPDEHDEAVDAIRRSMDEYERGEGRPAEEAFEALRRKLHVRP